MVDSPPDREPFAAKDIRLPVEATSPLLLERARRGDHAALEVLYARHMPALLRWASGRLPQWSRDLLDTVDLVQETLLQSMKHIDRFENRGEGALLAYLRQGVINRIKDQKRNATRRPPIGALDTAIPDVAPSPLEDTIGREALERYEAALQNRLNDEERQAVISRLELGHSYAEIAALLKKPSKDAARMLVARALVKLAEEMERGQ
jgi:RNA polymerase sigma factor (sigma-70 family)